MNMPFFLFSLRSINPTQKNPTLCLSCVNGQTTLCLSANKPESANQKQKNTWTRTNRLIQMYQKKNETKLKGTCLIASTPSWQHTMTSMFYQTILTNWRHWHDTGHAGPAHTSVGHANWTKRKNPPSTFYLCAKEQIPHDKRTQTTCASTISN